MELYDHFEGWVQNYCNSFTNVKRWQWFCTKPSIYNLTFCIILFLHIICHFVLFCMYVLFYVVTCPYGPWLIQINLETLKPTHWSPLTSRIDLERLQRTTTQPCMGDWDNIYEKDTIYFDLNLLYIIINQNTQKDTKQYTRTKIIVWIMFYEICFKFVWIG